MKKNNIKNYVLDKEMPKGVRYVGDYYRIPLDDSSRRRGGLLQMSLGLLDMILIILTVSIPAMGCSTVYVVIPLELILFCSLYYITGSYAYMKSSSVVEQKVYDKAYVNRVQSMAVALVCNTISLIGQLILIIRKHSLFAGYQDYLLFALILLLLIYHWMIWQYHRKLLKDVVKLEKETSFDI